MTTHMRHGAVLVLAAAVGCQKSAPALPASCGDKEICLFVDASQTDHMISPLLFGEQVQWYSSGEFLWDSVSNGPRADMMSLLDKQGITNLRYPGGTLSDFFHWEQAVGSQRIPQVNPFGSSATQLKTELPVFGPDELAQVATSLGTELLITVNVGTGTPDEAARWLAHYQQAGVHANYWEVGNEVYIAGNDWASTTQRKTPVQYAALFDQYAKALRQVDPTVKVGAIVCHESGLCDDPNWNQKVLSTVTQPIDFVAVHNSYAPIGWDSDASKAFQATLAAPLFVRRNFDTLEADLAPYPLAQGAEIAVTEHAAFFVPGPMSQPTVQLQRNRTLAAALYSALLFHLFMADSRIAVANHFNLINPFWQAPITPSIVNMQVTNPTPSIYYHAFRLYADAAGATYVPAPVQNSPTYDAASFSVLPAENQVPVLDAVAALSPAALSIYVVNRDLANDVTAHVRLRNFAAGGLRSVTADVLDAADYQAVDDPATPDAVQVTTTSLAVASDFMRTFPAHSLTRLTFQ